MAKVRVEQKDGEITLSYQGNPPVTYKVTDHEVTVAAADVPVFLDSVPGAVAADDAAKAAPDLADADTSKSKVVNPPAS